MEKSYELYKKLREEIILEMYHESYNIIQSLGTSGLHDQVAIIRGDALRSLNKAKNNLLKENRKASEGGIDSEG